MYQYGLRKSSRMYCSVSAQLEYKRTRSTEIYYMSLLGKSDNNLIFL